MLPTQRNKQVMKVLGRLRQGGMPSVVEFDSESPMIDQKTVASPASTPTLDLLQQKSGPKRKKKPSVADDEAAEPSDESEQTDY